jgi:hypothetical protein
MSLRADRREARQSQGFATERLPRPYGLAMTNSLRALSPLRQKGIEMKIKRKQLKKECTADIGSQRVETPEFMCDDIYLVRLLTEADDKGNNKDAIPLPARCRGRRNRQYPCLRRAGAGAIRDTRH